MANGIKLIQGVFIMAGTIIGVGMFGIPFAFMRSGLAAGLIELAVLTAVMVVAHLAYGETILRTNVIKRLPGYVEYYLGSRMKTVSLISYFFGLSGSILVYVAYGGKFLGDLAGFADGSLSGPVLFWAAGAIFIFFSIRQSGWADTFLNAALVFLVFAFFFISTRYMSFETAFWLPRGGSGDVFLPYGVILFALAGATAVPEARSLFGKGGGSLLKSAILWGTVIPAFLYALFAIAVLGISGDATTPDAILGIKNLVSPVVVTMAEIIALLAIFTSFIVIGLTLKESYYFDFYVPHFLSWLLASFIPLLFFLFGFQDFIKIIGIIGAFSVGTDAFLTLWVYKISKKTGTREPEYSLEIKNWIITVIMIVFALGVALETYFLI